MTQSVRVPLLPQTNLPFQQGVFKNRMLKFSLCLGSVAVVFSAASFILMINESIHNKCNNSPLKISISALELGSSLALVLGVALSFFCCRSFERRSQDLRTDPETLGIEPETRAPEVDENSFSRDHLVGAGGALPMLGPFSPEGIERLVEELEGMDQSAATARMLALFLEMVLSFRPGTDVSNLRGIIFATRVVPRDGGSGNGTISASGTPVRGAGELSD